MTKREFAPSPEAIHAQAGIHIAASPRHVAAVYRDVEKWGETFPATIERARVIDAVENWQQIEVQHKQEGFVPNTLIFLSDTEIGLEESKKKYNASFLNEFKTATDGTTYYVITSFVNLKGIYKLLKPFLRNYVRGQSLRQMRRYVLEPLKLAVERKYT